MGAGASALSHGDASKFHATISQNVLEGKPLDASDIQNLEEAKDEIKRLRQLANKILRSGDGNVIAGISDDQTVKKKVGRAAVLAKSITNTNYVKKTVDKSDAIKDIILNSIKQNVLFKACTPKEIIDIVDAFEPIECPVESVVIKQGDAGEHFYVVEKGRLDIFVRMGGDNGKNVKVGSPYVQGSAFGELALMYNTPRAATIQAREDCKMWMIDRETFRGINFHHKLERKNMYTDFLKKVVIGGKLLGDFLSPVEIDNMTLVLERDTFKKGDVIIREGEKGDIFYMIESGTVDVFTKKNGVEPVASLIRSHFFGEKALLSEDVRQATCVATSDVECLFMMREDFVLLLGEMQDLLDGKHDSGTGKQTGVTTPEIREPAPDDSAVSWNLSDLDVKQTLGMGAFGRVKLVKVKATGASYALKCLSKKAVVENGLQEHIMNEKKIMAALDHPFITKFYAALQDDRYVYFLLEVLIGGELFTFLRNETQFPEQWSRFYAASVLMAYCQIHSRKIAYRDLKPENLVLDSLGYVKIVDFGLAKKVEGKTWTLCGTPDYLAPEIILNEGHDLGVDYWALGVLIYEMTAGIPPFYADSPMDVYEKILSGHINIPSYFSRSISDLVKKLLKTYQSKRLGKTKGGTGTVMKHKWFSGFDWDALLNKELTVPIKPKLKSADDPSNFDSYPEDGNDMPGYPQWQPKL